MKPTDQETELRTALRPSTDRVVRVTERRIQDALAHARSGNLPVASSRMDELGTVLIQHVENARGAFYRQAFQQHARAGLDPEMHQVGLGPDADGERAARSVPILGRRYNDDLVDAVEDAQAALTSAALADQNGGSFLQSWADQTRDRLTALTARQLSDAQIAIFEAVGQILIKPELR